ncbi:hypothetical protein ICY20_24140 [Pseudomonas sp. P115]|uniref:hypothetical protein n=1 Tax=Pseudomonas pisciculturae TaxID=2730413 RepID=UPI0018927CBD|nr:hypothetical protein [Pseudomonas pisciculturae]MBF6030844.1 hypothetical protein [Pseudomonas pisciculturae]
MAKTKAKKQIGPNFHYELVEAGVLGLPFGWTSDGDFTFNEDMTQEQTEAVLAVYEAHDPAKEVEQAAAE